MSFPLQQVLELRQTTEEEAARAVATAAAVRARAEEEQGRLEECAAAALARTRGVVYDGPLTAGRAHSAELYRQRLDEEARAAQARACHHREGPLAAARATEEDARTRHAAARREREALDRVIERERTAQRQVQERRAEGEETDLASARRRA